MDKDEKDDPVASAKAFLAGLKGGPDRPWDTAPTSRPSPAPAASPSPAPKTGADDAMDQAEKIRQRNEDFAKRTRHLRQN